MNKQRASEDTRPGRCCVVSAWRPELEHLANSLSPSLRRGLRLAPVGVGLVEAAAGTARLIAEQRPETLVLVGTAGVYPGQRREFPLGTAVAIEETALLSQILPGKHTYLPDLMEARQRTTPALTRSLREATNLPLASVACPLAITASAKATISAARLSGCALENLEAFAVARAAAIAGVPFAAILGIANHVGPAGHREWKKHARPAAAAACDAVLAWLRSL